MIQPIFVNRGRMPIAALGAVALFGFGVATGAVLPRSASSSSATPIVANVSPVIAQQPVVVQKKESAACGEGAYITGDLVGDASPATVYATMCGTR
jgi:hypothetical protein